jgi:hypothetical protein
VLNLPISGLRGGVHRFSSGARWLTPDRREWLRFKPALTLLFHFFETPPLVWHLNASSAGAAASHSTTRFDARSNSNRDAVAKNPCTNLPEQVPPSCAPSEANGVRRDQTQPREPEDVLPRAMEIVGCNARINKILVQRGYCAADRDGRDRRIAHL